MTRSATLTHDVTGCSGDGVDIGANGVRLDLNGHAIGALSGSAQGIGINLQGHDHVTVYGGPGNSVRGFATGVLANGLQDTIEHVTTLDSFNVGVRMTGSGDRVVDSKESDAGYSVGFSADGVEADGPYEVVDHNVIAPGHGSGVELGASHDSVTNSTITGELSPPRYNTLYGVQDNGTGSTVAHNTIASVSYGIAGAAAGLYQANTIKNPRFAGILVDGNFAALPTDVIVKDNRVLGSGVNDESVGYKDFNSAGDSYSGNRAQRLGIGFYFDGASYATVRGNVAGSISSRSGGNGGNGGGFLIAGGTGDVITGNNASHNTNNYGGCNPQPDPDNPYFPCVQDGIQIDNLGPETATTIAHNTTNFNFGDGIDDASISGTIARNQANHNGRYGIEEVGGAVDGGHNTAVGNTLGQCLNITCP